MYYKIVAYASDTHLFGNNNQGEEGNDWDGARFGIPFSLSLSLFSFSASKNRAHIVLYRYK